ncbi:MAG: galactose mutarotase [Clostridiales bacterium]|nr:galactose mutarotase [Clostridiales bacterium]
MITKSFFDDYNGVRAHLYTLTKNGLTVQICDFGATVYSILVKTPKGEVDVCLGYPRLCDYAKSGAYCGATVGRVANRIGGASFILNGKKYCLPANEKCNTHHGGYIGFSHRLWQAEICGEVLKLSLLSPANEQGFPANLLMMVEYEIVGNALDIRYSATADGDTLWAPTNHAYFNLNGEGCGDILGTLLQIKAQSYTPTNAQHICTGEVACTKGTPFDFSNFKKIGADICANDEQLSYSSGYDCNYVISGYNGQARHVATAIGEVSGISLLVYSNLPGLQFYSGNYLKGKGKSGEYSARHGFCLEPQYFPNAINCENFLSPIIKGGENKKLFIRYEFRTFNP